MIEQYARLDEEPELLCLQGLLQGKLLMKDEKKIIRSRELHFSGTVL